MTVAPGRYVPEDLVRCIADYSCHSELGTLAALNSYFYYILTPNLYANVKLESKRRIKLFCETLVYGRTHLAEYPRIISFSPRRVVVQVNHTFSHLIREALLRTVNLVDLELSLPSKAVKTIFRDVRYQFELHRLACPLVSSSKFSRFLSSQPTIQELIVLRNIRGSVTVGTSIRNIDSKSLPRLSSVSANLETLLALVPQRPLIKVDTGLSLLSRSQFGAFAEGLTRSSASVETVGATLLCDLAACMQQIEGFIDSLQSHRVDPKRLFISLLSAEVSEVYNGLESYNLVSPYNTKSYPVARAHKFK